MLGQLKYFVSGHWVAGSRAIVAAEKVEKTLEFSAPVEFHGEAGYWTPEQFLLAGVASCFTTTFHAIAGNSKFDAVELDVAVEGRLSRNPGGYDFAAVVIRPRLVIRDESDRPRAVRLLEKTERGCLVARSLKCEVTMEATIEVFAPATTARA
jgi:organic hydroperoxide reductase OsmC/OhrA